MLRSRSIDDLSWAKPEVQEKSLADKRGYEEYLNTKLRLCEEERVSYREVFTFPTRRRLERALKLIDQDLYGYSASYFDLSEEDRIPRLSFILFDYEEVVIFFYSGGMRSAKSELRLSVTDRHIVALFQDFYDNIFDSGTVLKDADQIDEREVEKLRQVLAEWGG